LGALSRCRRRGTALAIDFTRAPVACGDAGATRRLRWDKATESLTLRPCLVQFESPPNDTPAGPDGCRTPRRGLRSLRQHLLDRRLVGGNPASFPRRRLGPSISGRLATASPARRIAATASFILAG
jgi:hypothetical protein